MSLQSLLNQTITLYTRSDYDEFGQERYSTGISYPARFQRVTRTRILPSDQNSNYQTVVIDAIAYINGEVDINVDDKVVYSDENFKVHGRTIQVNGRGNSHHTKVELVKIP